jgi:hypothetical protein
LVLADAQVNDLIANMEQKEAADVSCAEMKALEKSKKLTSEKAPKVFG